MARPNPLYDRLAASYVFAEVAERVRVFKRAHPNVELLRLGVGDTTLPLAPPVIEALHAAVDRLASERTYTGYGTLELEMPLRHAIASSYAERGVRLSTDEIFPSDGAKSDCANILAIFDPRSVVAVPDPTYPAYVDNAVLTGHAGRYDRVRGSYDRLVSMPCVADNGFFPTPPWDQHADVIYLCSPTNPTGVAGTRSDLEAFVAYAREHKAVIIFDAAYSGFIRDPQLPRSIYEIPGGEGCAIEIGSLSKIAGFTGVRLGWAVVPRALAGEGCSPGTLKGLWSRRRLAAFNGPSNLAQAGAVAALSLEGRQASAAMAEHYLTNAALIRRQLSDLGLCACGGQNAPFVWMQLPHGMGCWEMFDRLLLEGHIVTTPGVGFGPRGEGFLRLSGFGSRTETERAVERMGACLRQ